MSQALSIPQNSLQVDGWYVQNGEQRSGLPPNTTARDFKEVLQGSLTVSIPETFSRYPADICDLKKEIAALQVAHQGLSASHAALSASHADLLSRVARLEEDSARYKDVILRHVVDRVHAKLQKKFGEKPEGENWQDFIRRSCRADYTWFCDQNLDGSLHLLNKGFGSPYEAGNEAAHAPAEEHVERIVKAASESEPGWTQLWQFAAAGDA